MQLTFWWDNGDIEEWDSTYLSYHDGVILQGGRLLLADVEAAGIVYRPRYANEHAHKKNLIKDDIVLVEPEDVPHLLRVDRNGWTILQMDEYGELINVVLRAEADGRELRQIDSDDLTKLYGIDPETGEILDGEELPSVADAVGSWIDEAFEGLMGD